MVLGFQESIYDAFVALSASKIYYASSSKLSSEESLFGALYFYRWPRGYKWEIS